MAADRRTLRSRRKQERDLETANMVIRTMQAEGVSLFVTYLANSLSWQLSNGVSVTAAVAEIVIADARIIGVGDALFGDRRLSQTFGFIEMEDVGDSRARNAIRATESIGNGKLED